MIISDGDFVRNDYSIENKKPLPMGQDAYTDQIYANEAFLYNALDYMLDDYGLMLSRNKQVKIRPLNKTVLIQQGTYWRWLNTLGPLAVLFVLGLAIHIFRFKRFSKI